MSLADEWEKADDTLVRRTCKTCEWYATLDRRDQNFLDEKIEEALSSRGNMQRIRRAVMAAGHEVARSTFHAHVHEHHSALVEARNQSNGGKRGGRK